MFFSPTHMIIVDKGRVGKWENVELNYGVCNTHHAVKIIRTTTQEPGTDMARASSLAVVENGRPVGSMWALGSSDRRPIQVLAWSMAMVIDGRS